MERTIKIYRPIKEKISIIPPALFLIFWKIHHQVNLVMIKNNFIKINTDDKLKKNKMQRLTNKFYKIINTKVKEMMKKMILSNILKS
jgi:hypothetical protein